MPAGARRLLQWRRNGTISSCARSPQPSASRFCGQHRRGYCRATAPPAPRASAGVDELAALGGTVAAGLAGVCFGHPGGQPSWGQPPASSAAVRKLPVRSYDSRVSMISSSCSMSVPSGASVAWTTLERTPGGAAHWRMPVRADGCLRRSGGRRGGYIAAAGEFRWPPMGRFVAASEELLMAAIMSATAP